MAFKQFNMGYALHENNLVHISDVPSGLDCECVCTACGGRLIAKKGKIKVHHFAHYDSEECQYGYETSLHLAVKQLIMEHKKIMLPPVYLSFPGGFKEIISLYPSNVIKVDKVLLETRQEDKQEWMIPDLILFSGQRKLYVEICVTHAIDNKKLSKIKKMGISTIEIDLSRRARSIEKEDLEKLLFEDLEEKKWIYNSREKESLKKFLQVAKPMPIISRGVASYVYNCPMNKQIRQGKPFADLLKDCKGCRFCIAKGKSKIFCSGESRIADLDDFSKNLQERLERYSFCYSNQIHEEQVDEDKQDLPSCGICPSCGSKIRKKTGKEREYFVCSNYPKKCKFNVSVDKKTGNVMDRGINKSNLPFVIDEQ